MIATPVDVTILVSQGLLVLDADITKGMDLIFASVDNLIGKEVIRGARK